MLLKSRKKDGKQKFHDVVIDVFNANNIQIYEGGNGLFKITIIRLHSMFVYMYVCMRLVVLEPPLLLFLLQDICVLRVSL